jgi:threonine/homoserine/homoserine lactone efflux protein
MFTAALVGFLMGFVTSVPVAGPVSILVFSRGLQDRARSGAYLAVGAALAEAAYAFLAFWGFSELLVAYPWLEPLTGGAAAVILLALGMRFVRMAPQQHDMPDDAAPTAGSKRSFLLGLTIAGLNPTLLATWPAMVTFVHSLGLLDFGASGALPFSVGVALGISSWFLILLGLLARYRGRFRRNTLDRVVRGMGVVLTLIGIGAAVRFAIFLASLV